MARLAGEGVGRRQALNIGERRGGWILVHVEEQEVGNGQVVQFVGDGWMLTKAVQRVAE